MPTLEERLAALRSKITPYEVSDEERDDLTQAGEVGMYPGDESLVPQIQQAGRQDFTKIKTDRLALTDQVKKARIQEQQFRDQDSFLGQAKQTFSNIFTPDEVVQPAPVQAPVSPKPLAMQQKPAVTAPPLSAPLPTTPPVQPSSTKAGKLPAFSNPAEEESFLMWYGNKAVAEGLPRHPNHNPSIDYRQEFLKEQDGAVTDESAPYGMREDGTPKGKGYFGELPSKDGKFDTGSVSTELSATAEVDGKELFFPLLVPTLTRQEIDTLLSGQRPTDAIYDKAIAHAQQRIAQGKDPFAGEGEQGPLPTDAPEQPLEVPEVHVVGERIQPENMNILLPGMSPVMDKLEAERARMQATGTPAQNPLARYQPLEESKPLSLGEAFEESGKAFMRGVGHTSASAVKGLGIIRYEMDQLQNLPETRDASIKDYSLFKLGTKLDQMTDRLFPGRSDLKENFLLTVVPQAFGSSVAFLGTAVAGQALGASAGGVAAVTGALAGGAGLYEQGMKLNVSPEQRRLGFVMGGALGATEGIPIADLFKRIDTATGGSMTRALKVGTVQAVEEAVQEGVQQLGENAVVQYLFGHNQKLLDGVGTGMGAGGIVGFLTGAILARKGRYGVSLEKDQPDENQAPTPDSVLRQPKQQPLANTSPFEGEPVPKGPRQTPPVMPGAPKQPITGMIPDQLHLAQRPPFLIKQQPAPAAPELPPAMVPTSPEQAPVLSQEGGRPVDPVASANQPILGTESVQPVESAQDLGARTTPLPPSLAPVLESPSQAPAAPAMTPEEIVPGADLTDRKDSQEEEDEAGKTNPLHMPGAPSLEELYGEPSQPVEKQEVAAEEPAVLVGDANFKEGERVSFEQNGKTMTGTIMGYQGDELDVQVEQPSPLGGEPLIQRESVNVANPTLQRLDTKAVFTPDESVKPGTRASQVSQETAKSKSAELEAYIESLPQDEAKRAYARALVDGLKSGNLPAEPKNLTGAEIQAIQKGLMDAVAKGKVTPSPVTPDAVVDQAAHEAATSPKNDVPTPTEAMQQAGNYRKGHVSIAGLDISIENPQGSTRSGKDASGKPWSVQMKSHYGYIKGTVGKDKDHVDVFIKPGTPEDYSGTVYVVDQRDPKTGKFDEHKVILGAGSMEEAKQLYRENYKKGWAGLGGIRSFPMEGFKEWVKNPEATKQLASAYNAPKKTPSYTVTSAELVPTRGPNGEVKWVTKNVTEETVPATPHEVVEKPTPIEASIPEKGVPGYTSSGAKLLQEVTKGKEPIVGTPANPATPETVVEKPKEPTIAVPSPNFQDLLASVVRAEKSFNAAETQAEKEKYLQKVSGIVKDFQADPGRVTSDEYKTRLKSLNNILSRMNGEMEKFEKSITPDTVAKQPTKGAIITQSPTPEEATHGQPDKPGLADTRSPEGTPTEAVSGVEGEEPAPSVREGSGKPGQRSDGRTGGQRPSTTRGLGDREGQGTASDRGGRSESERDDTAVQRPDPAPPAGHDFAYTEGFTFPSGQKAKYRANVEAIKLIKTLDAEGRLASPDEQAVLAKFTGWGGLPQAFEWSRDWQKEYEELSDLLTEDEYKAARASTPNAHYTDPSTIRAIYRGIEHLGFKGGRLLEPGAGSGLFLGVMPANLAARSQRTAIELDTLSAKIAKQLYQRANVVNNEYQSVLFPDNFFDVAVGNVPFANITIFDPNSKDLTKLKLSLHDYYFAKSLSQVRPGGIVAFITSRYTMDKVNGKMRDYVASKADLLGAIRLPNTQFKDIANTDVTTDILVFQRREDNTPAGGESWAKTEQLRLGDETITVNEYFARHPEQIMGKLSTKGTMYSRNEVTVENDGRDMSRALDDAFNRLPENAMKPRKAPASVTPRGILEALEATDDVKEGAYTIQNNALYIRRGPQFVAVEDAGPTVIERAKGLIGLREQVREVFRTQLAGDDEKAIKAARLELNKRYDKFTKKWGPIHSEGNRRLFRGDPDYPTLQALEKWDKETKTAKKADIFSKRVIEYRPKATKVETAKEAMLVSMNDTGRVDIDRMVELTGKKPADLFNELKGLVFKDPEHASDWESADSYLSGNVRKKLRVAREAAKLDPTFQPNVEALETVQPKDLEPTQINIKLGHGWIPTDVYESFVNHLFGVRGASVQYNAAVGAFAVKAPIGNNNTKNDTEWGTPRALATSILADALHSQQPTVYDRTSDDKRIVNEKETLAAREKLEKMQAEFTKWLWSDPERSKRLARIYNDEYNAVRLQDFDGSHLTLPGANPLIKLRPHQKNGIWRALQSGNTLLGHVVGAGKTFTMVGIAMEARRLRMANKPMYVVPNHLTEYWGKSILQLYPAAKVLVPTKADFKKENRRQLLSKVATGDWDGVVVAHSQLAKLPISLEAFKKFVDEQVQILEEYIREIKDQKGGSQSQRNIVKELEKSKKRLEAKLKAREAAVKEKADQGVTFEESGVDMLLIDEADLFKNLFFPTRMTRVAGLPNTESQRAYDLLLKTNYLNSLTGQRAVHFGTGTPISNSMAEVFTMQRYLQPKQLEEAGLQHFDSWARQFGNVVVSMELAPDGSGYRPRTRFAEFVNVPELTQLFRQVMDVKLADELKLPVPKLKGGAPINVTSPPSEALKAYTKSLIDRAAALKGRGVDPRVDNMLKITGDGRNAALDIRLRVPGAPEDKNGKVAKAVGNIADVYKRTSAYRGAQLVFLDLSTPKGEGKSKESPAAVDEDTEETQNEEAELAEEASLRGSVYQDIKRKLIKNGIAEKEIAFIHDADTEARKEQLFADVNAGKVRVLIGSTEKMGAGTNVQQRLVALHSIDAPWRPRDLEQREGRIIRQGNLLHEFSEFLASGKPMEELPAELQPFLTHKDALKNFEIEVYRYATEAPSFDVYMWQTLELKAKTIAQIMKGDPNIRTIQDVDAAVMSYAEMKAIASGNPMIMERVKVETELHKLTSLASFYVSDRMSIERELKNNIPFKMDGDKENIRQYQQLKELRDANPAEPFKITLEDTKYTDEEKAGKAAKDLYSYMLANSSKATGMSDAIVGNYRGFIVKMETWNFSKSFYLYLKHPKVSNSMRTTEMDGEVNPAGVVERMNNALNRIEQEISQHVSNLESLEKRKVDLAEQLKKPFEHDERIKELETRLAEIDKALDLSKKDEGVIAPTEETPKKDDDGPMGILKSERGSIPVSLFTKGPKYAKDAAAYRELRLKEERGFMSSDESVEARVRAAKQGVQPGALWPRLKEHLNHVWHLVSREYEHLPDTAEFSPLRTDLLRLQKYKGIAADQTQRELAAIVKPLDKKQYDQFEWKALLSDLKREAEEERALPFGYTPEKVQEDLDRLDEIIERDPKVREAWNKRQALWARLKNEYQKSMDAIGFDTSKKLTKTDYFRHQVLEYARERHLKGTGSRVRTPTGRGFLKVRQGSSMDINANYVQAEFEVMAQMVYDTQLAEVIRNVDKHYNIRRALEQEAKAQNNESLQRIIDEGGLRGALVEGNMKDFRQRIGMHMGMLRKALELEKGDPLSMEDIAEMAGDPDSPGNLSSRGILKAISERKAFVKETLGREFVTWDMLVPETHELWQPREGNVFYMADSIPAQLAKALQEGMLAESGITPEQLRKVLAMGNPREQYVIPKEAATTLNDLSHKEHHWIVEWNRSVLNHWKQLMLLSPRRAVRYNVRNISGDADATFVGNPSAFKKYPQAGKELIPVIFKDEVLTGEAKEWTKRGGYGSTLQMQELGDVNDLKAFKHSLDRASKGGWLKAPATLWNAYWKSARLSTDYREAIGRYAAYLDYLEQMRENNGRPKNFGASIPETVMALPDIRDRAYKLSNELLGAYDRVSVAGQTIRSFWIPFWSWQEVNSTRYVRMFRNIKDAGDMTAMGRLAGVGVKKGTLRAASFLIKAAMFWSLLQVWNLTMYGDDEDELREANPTVANRPHILFGRSEKGEILYLAGIGALGDLLAWFGLDAAPGVVGDLMHDRLTLGESFKNAWHAPINKIVGGINPVAKALGELAFRQSIYPDVFHPRPIQDRVDYLADQTTFGPEIKAMRGKPGKPLYGGDDLTGLLVQRTDPKAAAYSTWQGIEKKYLERMGKESSAVFWRSPRGQALANWSRAIADHDEKAEAHYKTEYERLEREKHGMKFSQTKMWHDIEQSLRAKAPLAGVTIAERNAIVKELDEQEQRTLHKAETYYRDTLLSVIPEVRRRSFAHKLERKGWLTREPMGMTPELAVP